MGRQGAERCRVTKLLKRICLCGCLREPSIRRNLSTPRCVQVRKRRHAGHDDVLGNTSTMV
jgi:hypothetical protein